MIKVTIHFFGKCSPNADGSPLVKEFRNENKALAYALAEELKVSVRRVDVDPAP